MSGRDPRGAPQSTARRALLAAATATVAGAAFEAPAAPATGSAIEAAPDPRRSAEGQVKMVATLDGSTAYWSYGGYLYAVMPHTRPVAILSVAGCQAMQAWREPDTGAFLDTYENRFTGRRDIVQPNVFAGGGFAVFPPDGSAMRIGGRIAASQSAPGGFQAADQPAAIGRVAWSFIADDVVLATDQAFDVKIQPQMESQTRTADRRQFFDPAVRRLRTRFSATTVTPWLAWMDMAQAEGHLVWHTAGEKLFDISGLPADYRDRAGPKMAQLNIRIPEQGERP